MTEIAAHLLHWFDRHGRHDLPWQHPRTAYRVWIAEVMLQQTQVATVLPFYLRFMNSFPTLGSLAVARLDEVLAQWSGLGYYSRARNLHRAAQRCVEEHGGKLPVAVEQLAALPGIGRSTAAAIAAQAFDARHAILDGNVRRVLCRLFAIEGWPGSARVEKQLWKLSEALLPDQRMADYTQAIMDFGATLCTRNRPDCENCPVQAACLARQQGRVAELPSPRPAKPLPQRSCVMLMLRDDGGAILLQRRPPVGVWAGLWSLPQFDDIESGLRWAGSSQRIEPEPRALPVVDHGFSHYRLRIDPWLVRSLGKQPRIADNADLRWAAADDLEALGLPAPVRRLLQHAFGDEIG